MSQLAYRRILLKLSGEALMGDEDYGIDPKVINRLAREVIEAQQAGAEVALVIGGGKHLPRRRTGRRRHGPGHRRPDGHAGHRYQRAGHADALEKLGAKARVMSAIKINDVCEDYIRRRAIRHLEKGPAGDLRRRCGQSVLHHRLRRRAARDRNRADLLLKATKVDGVYDKDPKKHADAVRYDSLSYDQ